MKLIIFGATGGLGQQVVEQALEQGHQVTAFARNPAALTFDHPHLTRLAGDVLNPETVADAVSGHDAAIVALGAGRKGGIRAPGTKNVIDGMERHGIRRLVALSTIGIGESRGNLNFLWRYIMFGLLLRPAFADHEAQEVHIRQSDLDWIIVRPAAFTEGPATGEYKEGFSPNERNLELKISRADVASAMLKQLTSDTYLHQAPAFSY